ncbi:MAG TPA: hypothetical protein VF754_06040, partial [Pyrinomonadaceae bacterium]
QVESVERILSDLGHTSIPRLVAFNKSDAVAPEEMEAILRQAAQDGRECLSVSALAPATLRPLIERAGEILARDLMDDAAPEAAASAAAVDAAADADDAAAPAVDEETQEEAERAAAPVPR